MNQERAGQLLEEFRRTGIAGYTAKDLIGHGWSAAVIRATAPDGDDVALKVYDPLLRARYGAEVEQDRVALEMSLRGHDCSTLVGIVDGGPTVVQELPTRYLVMELVEGVDLRALVTPSARPADAVIRSILADLWAAADFLLHRGLLHRDIKVDNVRLRTSDGRAVLLDLGVVRRVDEADVTGGEERSFDSTTRYAPPELLHLRSDNSRAGWEAICVYQIGTVLYELVQGAVLFGHVSNQPQADLVSAVDREVPSVLRSDVGQDLVDLVRRCLEKDPVRRLKLASWASLRELSQRTPPPLPTGSAAIDQKRREARERHAREIVAPQQERAARAARTAQTAKAALDAIRAALISGDLPAPKFTEPHFDSANGHHVLEAQFSENLAERMPIPFALRFRLVVDEAHVQVLGNLIYGRFLSLKQAVRGPTTARQARIAGARGTPIPPKSTFEQIADMILDVESLRPLVADWVHQLLGRYFDVTEGDYEEALAARKGMIGRTGVFSRTYASGGNHEMTSKTGPTRAE